LYKHDAWAQNVVALDFKRLGFWSLSDQQAGRLAESKKVGACKLFTNFFLIASLKYLNS
jgi:hypothetical protein